MLLLKSCPCYEFSRLVMKIVHRDCGHIKSRWDNHHNCLKRSSCSRLFLAWRVALGLKKFGLLQISIGLMLQESQWWGKDRTRREERVAIIQIYLMTLTMGKTHRGGSFLDAECSESVSPPVNGHQSRSTRHRSACQWSTRQIFMGQNIMTG